MHDLAALQAACPVEVFVEQHPAGNGTPGKAGAPRIAEEPWRVNLKAKGLNSNEGYLLPPGRLDENPVLLPEIAGRRSDYGSITDYDFAILLQGLTDVFFTYELGKIFRNVLRC